MNTRTLLKIGPNLSVLEHQRASELLREQNLDGIELSSFGGAYGPVWDPQGSYDLDFLHHYAGLRELHIGVRLKSLAGIERVAPTLRALSLADPPGRQYVIDLEPLVTCTKLVSFGSAWRGLDYEPLSRIVGLRDLGLTGGGDERLEIAAALPELRRLSINFGSAKSLGRLSVLKNVEHFSSLRVAGLGDLAALAGIPSLRTLELDSLKTVRELPDLRRQANLTTVLCTRMNGLESLDGLAASSVRELAVIACAKLRSAAFARISGSLPRLERLVLHLPRKQDTAAVEKQFDCSVRVPSTNAFDLYYEHYTRFEYRAFNAADQ